MVRVAAKSQITTTTEMAKPSPSQLARPSRSSQTETTH